MDNYNFRSCELLYINILASITSTFRDGDVGFCLRLNTCYFGIIIEIRR
jgi:hypothetical protein